MRDISQWEEKYRNGQMFHISSSVENVVGRIVRYAPTVALGMVRTGMPIGETAKKSSPLILEKSNLLMYSRGCNLRGMYEDRLGRLLFWF